MNRVSPQRVTVTEEDVLEFKENMSRVIEMILVLAGDDDIKAAMAVAGVSSEKPDEYAKLIRLQIAYRRKPWHADS